MAQAERWRATSLRHAICSGGAAHHGLGAVGAAARVDGNFAQALGTLLGGWIRRLLAAIHAGDEGIYRENHKEVDNRGDQNERDRSEKRRVGKECRSRWSP